jgi:hypothetical protein
MDFITRPNEWGHTAGTAYYDTGELLGSILIGMKQGETVQKFGNPRIKKGITIILQASLCLSCNILI